MLLAETLYAILFAAAVLAPLRVSLISYLVLSTIDFDAAQGDIGLLNLARGVLLPCYLLWRLRAYSGHRKIILAPIAWILLIIYAACGRILVALSHPRAEIGRPHGRLLSGVLRVYEGGQGWLSHASGGRADCRGQPFIRSSVLGFRTRDLG